MRHSQGRMYVLPATMYFGADHHKVPSGVHVLLIRDETRTIVRVVISLIRKDTENTDR